MTGTHASIRDAVRISATSPAPRPTLSDVARAAGVSAATASRVLNGFPRVRPETRRQVESVMASMGYVRQRAVRATQGSRTGSVAFVVCEEGHRLFADPFFTRMAWATNQVLGAAGVPQVLLIVRSAMECQPAALRYLHNNHVDGALLISMHGRHQWDLEQVRVPVVFGGRPLMPVAPTRLSYVDVDNRRGAERAARRLLDAGRRMIATVAGPKDMAPGVDRLVGFTEALADAGRFDPGLVVYGDFGQASGEHAVRRLLERRKDVDAIFAASDLMAVGALRALRRMGRRVPDDVAVIGFDDAPVARHTDPPLTTVRQPVEEMGARMAKQLLDLIGGTARAPSCAILDTELMVRGSG